MMNSFRSPGARKRPLSNLALAVALATGAAVGVTALEAPAYAQKKKKKDDEQPKKDYSKGFVAVYAPLSQLVAGEGADHAAAKAQIPALLAAIETQDDRHAAGTLIYSLGTSSQDLATQRQGVSLLLESGRVATEQLGLYNFLAGQLAFQAKDFAAARTYVQAAIDAGYTDNDPEVLIAEAYFGEDKLAEGLAALNTAISNRIAAGGEVPLNWFARGISVAYGANMGQPAADLATKMVEHHPSRDTWGDAIAIQRNFFNYESQELIDLLRLAARTNSLRNERDYVEYIEAADPRRLPGEVKRTIDAGVAAGLLNTSDLFVSDARTVANSRIAADQADLPSLERDARAASSSAVTAMAAGDAFLSYEQPAKAEEMYNIALSKPGVDTARVLTRLGIAQIDQGKVAEAEQTFAKVQGARQAIARLWAVYAKQKAS